MKRENRRKVRLFVEELHHPFKFPGGFFHLLFPVAFFYLELVFTLSTVGIHSFVNVLQMLFFSITTGAVFLLLTTLAKNKIVNRILKAFFLFAFSFLFGVIYLSYCEYQMFYDLNTMFAGAGGIFEYMHEIKIIVFNPSGITHLLLIFLPFILYVVFGIGRKLDPAEGVHAPQRVLFVLWTGCAILLSVIFVSISKDSRFIYKDNFSFEQGISRFGLLKSLQMEFTRGSLSKDETLGFSEYADLGENQENETPDVDISLEGSVSDNLVVEDIPEEEKPKEYGYNKLDIDFSALAAAADSEELATLDNYVAGQKASKQNEYTGLFAGKNLIFISAEAFSAEAIDERFTPTLYRLATKGIQFTDYYQPAICGTTGGEFHNIMGMLSVDGGTSMKEAANNFNYYTMGYQLSKLGYSGRMIHNGQLTFYDRNITHETLGYPEGFLAMENGLSSIVDQNAPYSDISMMKATLPLYFDRQPFNLYYMSCSGHSPYKESNSFARRNLALVEQLDCSDTLKYYFSTQIEFDMSLEVTLQMLEEAGLLDDTVIVISSDHFPYGLDDGSEEESRIAELYGLPSVDDVITRDHNRLIIWSGCLEDMDPIVVDTPVESTDILPTLLNLFGIEFDSRLLPGRDVFSDREPLVYFTTGDWKTDKGTYVGGVFTPVEGVTVPEDYVDRIKAVVRDKLTYSKGVLHNDYLKHVFPEAYEERESYLTKWMDEQQTEPAVEEVPVEEPKQEEMEEEQTTVDEGIIQDSESEVIETE